MTGVHDSISIVCGGPHRAGVPAAKPTRVISFSRGLTTTRWTESPVHSARRRREADDARAARSRDDATGDTRDLDGWLAGAVGPDIPANVTHLAAESRQPSKAKVAELLAAGLSPEDIVRAYGTQRWTPGTTLEVFGRQLPVPVSLSAQLTGEQSEVITRDVYSIKCPRCRDGRTRRAEKLWPLLDLIAEQTPAVDVHIFYSRARTLTIPEFWLIADEYDRRASAGS